MGWMICCPLFISFASVISVAQKASGGGVGVEKGELASKHSSQSPKQSTSNELKAQTCHHETIPFRQWKGFLSAYFTGRCKQR